MMFVAIEPFADGLSGGLIEDGGGTYPVLSGIENHLKAKIECCCHIFHKGVISQLGSPVCSVF